MLVLSTMKLLVLISFLAVARGDIAKGPSIFQYGNKVYLVVAPAVIVNVFQNVTEGSHLKQHDEIILNGPATEFSATLVKKANSTSMEVNFKWDDVDFSGEKENKTKLTSLSAKMTFTRKLRKYSLTGAEVTSAKINATRLTNISLQVNITLIYNSCISSYWYPQYSISSCTGPYGIWKLYVSTHRFFILLLQLWHAKADE